MARKAYPQNLKEVPLSMNVFPNPTNTMCQINVTGTFIKEALEMELLNFTGTVIKTIFNSVPENNSPYLLQRIIDLTDLSDGLYLLKADYGVETKLIKLIVKH